MGYNMDVNSFCLGYLNFNDKNFNADHRVETFNWQPREGKRLLLCQIEGYWDSMPESWDTGL